MKSQTTDKNSGKLNLNCLRRFFLTFAFVFLIFCSAALTSVFAQAGRLDPAFGNAGKVLGSTLTRTSNNIAVQPDGKILVAGQINSKFSVARFNADGSVDNTFGSLGVAQIDFYPNQPSAASALAVQADGKIVAVGQTSTLFGSLVDQSDFALARFLPTGALDTTFGTGGKVITPGSSIDDLTEIVIQPDGKIVTTGLKLARMGSSIYRGTEFFALRYTSNGALDSGFGNNGTVSVSFDIPTNPIQGSQTCQTLLLQPDGKIVVGGNIAIFGLSGGTAVARFLPNGQPDDTFGTNGKSNFTLFDGLNSMALYPDGKFILVGTTGGDFGVARLTTAGALDNTFGTGGKVTTSIEAQSDVATDVKIQPNGKIVVAGYSSASDTVNQNFALARYNPDGSLDISFDDDGKVITDFGNNANDFINGIALLADGKILAGGVSNNQIALARYFADGLINRNPFDFDGDGRADFAVYRPGNSGWYILYSSNSPIFSYGFGQPGDLPAPADYNGDGRTEVAIFRPTGQGDPNKAYFYILQTSINPFRAEQFGREGDVPVPGDWDGDGLADLAVYRDGSQTGGQSYFFYRPSSQPGVDFRTITWGVTGDKPVIGDYDGDGKLDAAVFRPSVAYWYVLRSSDNQFEQRQFGVSTDIPTPADFDGDGRTNFAVYRPSTGNWYTSTDPAINYGETRWGISTDLPVAADYDGDGRADIAVFRPEGGNWYVLRSTAGFTAAKWGANGDKPVPNIFVP
ncbi:MAG TPA: FG-GAP-like repeat-containing protein [Pyrinomonadaceae bacterium]|jgi:uncharacterized delta-60 repeat protein